MKERLKDLAIGGFLLLFAFPLVAAYLLCSAFAGCFHLLAGGMREDCDEELDGGCR